MAQQFDRPPPRIERDFQGETFVNLNRREFFGGLVALAVPAMTSAAFDTSPSIIPPTS